MTIKRLSLILLIVTITGTATFAQRKKITLKGAGKDPLVTYETSSVILRFDKKSLTDAFNKLQNTADDQRQFKEAMDKASKAGGAYFHSRNGPSFPEATFIKRLIDEKIGTGLIKAGQVTVFNKATQQNVSDIEFKDRYPETSFYFEGDRESFFTGRVPMNTETDTATSPAYEEVASVSIEEAPVEEVVAPPASDDQIYTLVEEPAQYPGGIEQLNLYVNRNLKKIAGCDGTAYVRFTINRDGTIADPEVIKGLGDECDREALRLVKTMGPWKPGKQNGQTVRVRFVLPVKFKGV